MNRVVNTAQRLHTDTVLNEGLLRSVCLHYPFQPAEDDIDQPEQQHCRLEMIITLCGQHGAELEQMYASV